MQLASGVACDWADALRLVRQASSYAQIDATPIAQQMVEGLRRLDSSCDLYIVSDHGYCRSHAQRAKTSYTDSSNSLATHSDMTTKPPASSPTKPIETQKAKKYMPAASESILLPPPPPTVTTTSAQSVVKREQEKARTLSLANRCCQLGTIRIRVLTAWHMVPPG